MGPFLYLFAVLTLTHLLRLRRNRRNALLKRLREASGQLSNATGQAETSKEALATIVQPLQLNESLYELYRPPGMPKMQVLFFHGFQLGDDDYNEAHLSTWKSGDESGEIWPSTWLAEEFPEAHIFSVSYNGSVKESPRHGNVRLFILAENLLSDILQQKIGQEPHCPVILVGHSFGGLVIKELCLHASHQTATLSRGSDSNSAYNKFLENVKGIFFYATPHRGIPFVDVAIHFINAKSPLLEYVTTLSANAAALNFQFDNLCKRYDSWRVAGLGENLPIKWCGYNGRVVVPEASSRDGSSFNIVEDANHFSICWPKKKISRSFTAFTDLLKDIATQGKIEEVPANFQHFEKPILGLDLVLKEVKVKLDEATRLGLVGMGGVGKTTLAMAFFNVHERHFEFTCFIREVKNVKGTVEAAVLAHIHHRGNIIALKDGLRSLRGKELLLVLDDVASENDLRIVSILLGDGIKVHGKSRFLATSRDSQLLISNDHQVYHVAFLDQIISEQVFLSYVFPGNAPPPPLLKLTRSIVEKCGGLPLTLEVVGKYLKVHGESELMWKEVLIALDKAEKVAGFDENLWAKLKISYDSLDEVEKNMFLDAAEVFNGCTVHDAKRAWSISARGFTNMHWQRLLDLSLVWEHRPYGYDLVGMHEQLSSLAKNIARTDGPRRIWNDKEDVVEMLTVLSLGNCPEDDVKDVVALKLDDPYATSVCSTGEDELLIRGGRTLCHMKHLRYLEMTLLRFDPPLDAALPSSLVRLICTGGNLTSLPLNPSVHKHLVHLELAYCNDIRTLPDDFGLFSSLQRLSIANLDLGSLPDSLGDLPRLEELSISGGWWRKLPDALGNLKLLKTLEIIRSPLLEELPHTLGNLNALEEMEISHCDGLSSLPDSLGQLSNLKKFTLCCEGIHELPGTFLELERLEHLDLFISQLHSIPDIALLKNLKHVEFYWEKYSLEKPKLPPCLGELILPPLESISDNPWDPYIIVKVVDGQFIRQKD